jgi:hypothetical protein
MYANENAPSVKKEQKEAEEENSFLLFQYKQRQ